jgi:hypothetical protein
VSHARESIHRLRYWAAHGSGCHAVGPCAGHSTAEQSAALREVEEAINGLTISKLLGGGSVLMPCDCELADNDVANAVHHCCQLRSLQGSRTERHSELCAAAVAHYVHRKDDLAQALAGTRSSDIYRSASICLLV